MNMKDTIMRLITMVYCVPWILLIFMYYKSVCVRLWQAVVASSGLAKKLVQIAGNYAVVCWLRAIWVEWINNIWDVTRILDVLPTIVKYGNSIVFSVVIAGAGCRRIHSVILKKGYPSSKEILSGIRKIMLWLAAMFVTTRMGITFEHIYSVAGGSLYSILLTASNKPSQAFVIFITIPAFTLFLFYKILLITDSEASENKAVEQSDLA